jgi:hypothetical protein
MHQMASYRVTLGSGFAGLSGIILRVLTTFLSIGKWSKSSMDAIDEQFAIGTIAYLKDVYLPISTPASMAYLKRIILRVSTTFRATLGSGFAGLSIGKWSRSSMDTIDA